jgi:HPt (histidine-containing phosphotransfer) domain-containing protein
VTMEDVKRKFLPRFAALAKERIRHGREIAASVEGDQAIDFARELHSMAGEAGLLGLGELLALARNAEVAAMQLHASRVPSKRTALEQALLELERAVAVIARDAADADADTKVPSQPSKRER